jgi:hypothetical protein
MNRNLIGSIYGKPSIKIANFVPIRLQTWPPQAIIIADWWIYRSIWNKNCLWRPCLLMGQNEMSTLYREPSIDASYQVSIHLVKRFQRRFVEIDQPETLTVYHHRQFLLLISWFLKSLLLWNREAYAVIVSGWSISKILLKNCFAKWIETW